MAGNLKLVVSRTPPSAQADALSLRPLTAAAHLGLQLGFWTNLAGWAAAFRVWQSLFTPAWPAEPGKPTSCTLSRREAGGES
jgi:hypothetical protein